METTICGWIAQQGLAHPKRTAIIDGEVHVDYQGLLQRANQVAGELQHLGVAPGALVGVCMHRTWELVATLLGVMQAGCAYVPLDPAYPQDRVRYMLENSRAVAVIVDTESNAGLCEGVRELIRISQVSTHSDTTVRPAETDLAYVIYTSGSTGKPKGVAVEHRNVLG
ncbi:MAG: AMP-binding protein, partial [Bacteroidota bacterium]